MDQLNEALTLAKKLSPPDQLRLIEKLAAGLEQEITFTGPRRSLYGVWKDVDVSTDDIEELRHENWSFFPRDDI